MTERRYPTSNDLASTRTELEALKVGVRRALMVGIELEDGDVIGLFIQYQNLLKKFASDVKAFEKYLINRWAVRIQKAWRPEINTNKDGIYSNEIGETVANTIELLGCDDEFAEYERSKRVLDSQLLV